MTATLVKACWKLVYPLTPPPPEPAVLLTESNLRRWRNRLQRSDVILEVPFQFPKKFDVELSHVYDVWWVVQDSRTKVLRNWSYGHVKASNYGDRGNPDATQDELFPRRCLQTSIWQLMSIDGTFSVVKELIHCKEIISHWSLLILCHFQSFDSETSFSKSMKFHTRVLLVLTEWGHAGFLLRNNDYITLCLRQ